MELPKHDRPLVEVSGGGDDGGELGVGIHGDSASHVNAGSTHRGLQSVRWT
jgi:hypothetical protein